MLLELLPQQRIMHPEGRETHYALAGTHAMLCDRQAALAQLRKPLAREPAILSCG
jgi:hypothetical protein